MPNESAKSGSFTGPGPGTVLDGKYEILSRIGAGGMGEIFKARHLHLNTFRCIKVMKQALLADEVFLTRFLREARLATQIHHPNIAVVHDFFIGEGVNYMVTEFIDGTTLRQWAAMNGPFPVALAADVASQILSGLDHIHRRGLLHRDISPDNVMLFYDSDEQLIAKIIDLGIAKDVNTTSTEMTQAGVLIGNPKYMSPEQLGMLGDDEQIDGRADLYCLGVVTYEMLAGVAAFASETPQGYIMKHLTQNPPRFAVAKRGITVPDRMEQIIFRVLEKDRRRRFTDAREFAGALMPFLTAPAGTLHRDDVARMCSEEATVEQVLPVLGPNDATMAEMPWATPTGSLAPSAAPRRSTESKAHEFELLLLTDVHAREAEGDRQALQRLGEAHPRGTLVGDAARDALQRLNQAQQRDREEEEAFQRAWEDGRTSVWRAFIAEHAGSPRAERAQSLLEEALAFERSARGESETDIRQFLSVWPEGRHHLEAEIRLVALRQRLAADAFAEALAADTLAAMRAFLQRFGVSAHSEDACRIVDERRAFETAAAADTDSSWDLYLGKWSDDRHADDARVRRDRAGAREEAAYRDAVTAKTAAAWESFLARYPDGRRTARAERNRHEAIALDAARKGGRAGLQEFLRTYTDGLLTKDAQRLMRQVADADQLENARSLDTPAAWHLYLMTHAGGANAPEAQSRLVALEDIAFAALQSSNDPKATAAFLAEFPDTTRRDEIKRLTAMREAEAATHAAELTRQAEPRDFDDAWESGTTAAWDRYLSKHPSSERVAEARRCRQEAADFEQAVAANRPAMWRAFLKTWPEGRHRMDAALRVKAER